MRFTKRVNKHYFVQYTDTKTCNALIKATTIKSRLIIHLIDKHRESMLGETLLGYLSVEKIDEKKIVVLRKRKNSSDYIVFNHQRVGKILIRSNMEVVYRKSNTKEETICDLCNFFDGTMCISKNGCIAKKEIKNSVDQKVPTPLDK